MNIFREDQFIMSKPQPVWDRERRELRLGDIVVKRFRWPAVNQEGVLNAFSDLMWPSRIDDPLPRNGVNVKSKLHDTIKCLNQNQEIGLIKFRGDGTGRGVVLEIVSHEEAARRAALAEAKKLARKNEKAKKAAEAKARAAQTPTPPLPSQSR